MPPGLARSRRVVSQCVDFPRSLTCELIAAASRWFDDDTISHRISVWNIRQGCEIAQVKLPNAVTTPCALHKGRRLLSSDNRIVRLWDVTEVSRLELDHPIGCLVAFDDARVAAGDRLDRLHHLEIVDRF